MRPMKNRIFDPKKRWLALRDRFGFPGAANFLAMETVLMFFLGLTRAFGMDKCLPPSQAGILSTQSVEVPKSSYSVEICYLPERTKGGVKEAYHRDLVVLKDGKKRLAQYKTKIPITVGRIGDLALERNSDRFFAVSYGAGEFCNGIVIFDKKKKRVSSGQGCFRPSDICRVTQLSEEECSAVIDCKDQGAEGAPPKRAPYSKKINLCDGV